MARMAKTITPLIFGFIILSLSACGGGGGAEGVPAVTAGGGTTAAGNTATIQGAVKGAVSSLGLKPKSSLERVRLAAVPTSPIADADVNCYDLDSSSRTAAGKGKTDSQGNFSINVDVGSDKKGTFICFAIWLDPVSKKVKVANIPDIPAAAGQVVDVVKEKGEMTVVEDTLSPEIVGIHGDNTPDTSFSDGDPDPEFEPTGIPVGSKIGILFSEAVEPDVFFHGGFALYKATLDDTTKKCKKGALHTSSSEADVDFNGKLKGFHYLPAVSLVAGDRYILEIKRKVTVAGSTLLLKDLSGLQVEDNGDKDEIIATACFKAIAVETFKILSTKPANGAVNVPVGTAISVTFNSLPDFATLEDNVSDAPDVPDGHGEANGTTLTYFPGKPLAAGTTYTITFGTGIADLTGNKLAIETTVSFTTAKENITLTGGDADKTAIIARTEGAHSAFGSGDYNLLLSFFSPNFLPLFDLNRDQTINAVDAEEFLAHLKADLESDRQEREVGFYEIERIDVVNTAGTKKGNVQHFRNRAAAAVGHDVSLYHGWIPIIEGVDYVVKVVDKTEPGGFTFQEWRFYLVDQTKDTDPATQAPLCTATSQITTKVEVWEGHFGVDNDGDGKIDEDWRDGFGGPDTPGTDNDGDGKIDEDGPNARIDKIVCVKDGDNDPTNSWAENDEVYPDGKSTWEDNDADGFFDEDGVISLRSGGVIKLIGNSGASTDITNSVIDTNNDGKRSIKEILAWAAAQTPKKDVAGIDNDGDYPDPNPDPFIKWDKLNEDWRDWPSPIDNDNDGKLDEDSDGRFDEPSPTDGDLFTDNDPLTWQEQNKLFSSGELFLVPTIDVNAPWHGAGQHFAVVKGPVGWPYTYFDQLKVGTGTCPPCFPNAWDSDADGDGNPKTTDSTILIKRVPNVPRDLNGDGKRDADDYIYAGWNSWQYGITFDFQLDPSVVAGSHPAEHLVIDTEPSWLAMEGDDNNDGQINEHGRFADFVNGTGTNTNTLPATCANSVKHKNGTTLWPDPASDPDFAAIAAALAAGCDFSDGIDNNRNGQIDEALLQGFDDDGDGQTDEDKPGNADNKSCTDTTKDAKDDDCDGKVDEDGTNYERDFAEDHNKWQEVFLTTTDAVVALFKVVVEEALTFDTGVNLGTTANFSRTGKIDLTGTNFANAQVTFRRKETWTPHNPHCGFGGGPTASGPTTDVCDDVDTHVERNFFDYEKINGDWYLLSICCFGDREVGGGGAGAAPPPTVPKPRVRTARR